MKISPAGVRIANITSLACVLTVSLMEQKSNSSVAVCVCWVKKVFNLGELNGFHCFHTAAAPPFTKLK